MTHSTDESDRPGGDTTRASLLIRLRDPADREAWRLFVETYTPMIYGYCRRRGLQASDVADVTQDVMTEVMRSIREFSYQPERGRFRDWLGMIARRKLIRFFDREGRAGKGDGDAADELIRQVAAPESDTMWTEAFQRGSSRWRWATPALVSRTRPGGRSNGPGSTAGSRPRWRGSSACRWTRSTCPGRGS